MDATLMQIGEEAINFPDLYATTDEAHDAIEEYAREQFPDADPDTLRSPVERFGDNGYFVADVVTVRLPE